MEALLRAGLASLGLSGEAVPSLLRFAELLTERNKVMNLTAITQPEEIATLHFLDCAALLPLLDWAGLSVVDVGAGAGFPGLPLKIIEPSLRLTLLDAQRKRVDFLSEVCSDLKLREVSCIHGRAEEFAAGRREAFDVAVSRAVAHLRILCELCLPLVAVGGRFLAMKSVDSGGELAEAENAVARLGGRLERIEDYTIPGTDIRHRLIVIQKEHPTPDRYPRSFAKIKKAPL